MSGELLSFCKLQYDDGSTPGTFDGVSAEEVINLTSLNPPGAERPVADVTHLQSTAREEAALLAEFSACSFECSHVLTNAGHAGLLTDSIATTATVRNWKLEIQDPSDSSVIKTYEWIGQLTSFVPSEGPNQIRTASGEIKVNSGLTIA